MEIKIGKVRWIDRLERGFKDTEKDINVRNIDVVMLILQERGRESP